MGGLGQEGRMSVYLCIPSARPDGGTIPKWTEAGYKTAIWRDPGAPPIEANITIVGRYPGYSKASNALIKLALADPACQWVVGGGDDVLPEPNKSPEQIADECYGHFVGDFSRGTFGVMQPTADRYGENAIGPWPRGSAYIDRVCGSPWMGRAFCERINGGRGPWWEEFFHMFSDEALQNVALKLGILWQRRDLCHRHLHWGVNGDIQQMPEFLRYVNTSQHWESSKAIFERLKSSGFSEYLEIR